MIFDLSPFTAWTILSIVLVILELFIPGVWIVWFAIPTLLTGILTLIFGLGLAAQIISMALFSIITVAILFKFGRSKMQTMSDNEFLNQRGIGYIGQVHTLEFAVEHGQGRLKLGDSYWILTGEDCPIGTQIKLTKVHLNGFSFEKFTP